MRRAHIVVVLLVIVMLTLGACAPAPTPVPPQLEPPIVELVAIEVAKRFPWSDLPESSPMALDYIFSIENPNDFDIMLDSVSFTIGFEASPIGLTDEYFPVAKVLTFEQMWIPPKMANRLKVSYVHDSAIAQGLLELSIMDRLIEEGKSPTDIEILIKEWWLEAPSSIMKVMIMDGEAMFSSIYGGAMVTISEGCYPCIRRKSMIIR